MKIVFIDIQAILPLINNRNIYTNTFEIYSDLIRLLDIELSKEGAFKLFTKYVHDYGKLKDYLCIMGKNTNKQLFDDEFCRRFQQLYFHQDKELLQSIKQTLQKDLEEVSSDAITGFIAIGNKEFSYIVLKNFEIGQYFNTTKIGEYIQEYEQYILETIGENIVDPESIESITFYLGNQPKELENELKELPSLKTYPLIFASFTS